MADTIVAPTATSQDAPPPYSATFDQLLSEAHSHDHNCKLYNILLHVQML